MGAVEKSTLIKTPLYSSMKKLGGWDPRQRDPLGRLSVPLPQLELRTRAAQDTLLIYLR